MFFLKCHNALVLPLLTVAFGIPQAAPAAAPTRDKSVTGPVALATNAAASFCFARVRGLEPERLPPSYLVLRLRVTVAYRNEGKRPLILPLEHEKTIYTAIKPGHMTVLKQGISLFEPVVKTMSILPEGVSPDNPVTPKNDFFAVIPAGGEMLPPLTEDIQLPVNRRAVFRNYPDLRGRRVYVKLRYEHQKLAAGLEANLSDKWSRFGVPWTGTLTTNTILVDVPASPEAKPCQDDYKPAHPVVGDDDKK